MNRSYSDMTDEELILSLREGDDRVTDVIMDKYKDMVRKKARSMCSSLPLYTKIGYRVSAIPDQKASIPEIHA